MSVTVATAATLRDAAAAAADGELDDLGGLWRDLTRGRTVAADWFWRDARAFIVAEAAPAPAPTRSAERDIEVLTRTLRGEAQKSLAAELGLAESSISATAGRCLRRMGFACPPVRAPLLLVMAACASDARQVRARFNTFRFHARTYRVVSARLSAETLGAKLTPAEQEVVFRAVEGMTRSQIAKTCEKSVHTISNQMSSIFQKLGLNNRTSLTWYVAMDMPSMQPL